MPVSVIPQRLATWEELNRRVARLSEEVRAHIDAPFTADPHAPYFHFINDTAWSGMHLTTDQGPVGAGAVIAPYQTNTLADHNLVSNLANGTVTLDANEGGGYQMQAMILFQAISNGGTFAFEFFKDTVATGVIAASNLSNQSDIGAVTLVGFGSIAPGVLDIRVTSASKNITILDCLWTMTRMVPPLPP